jgi:hypothetical protein
MKKNAKIRLTLNRETLRYLGADEASGALGGGTTAPCNTVVCSAPAICHSGTCMTRCAQTTCF